MPPKAASLLISKIMSSEKIFCIAHMSLIFPPTRQKHMKVSLYCYSECNTCEYLKDTSCTFALILNGQGRWPPAIRQCNRGHSHCGGGATQGSLFEIITEIGTGVKWLVVAFMFCYWDGRIGYFDLQLL